VNEICERLNIVKITTPAYAPFVNGLIENVNKLLIGRLKRKYCPNLDEAEYEGDIDPASLPASWPDYFDECVTELNDRILPGKKFTLREVLFGLCLAPIHIPPVILDEPNTRHTKGVRRPDDVSRGLAHGKLGETHRRPREAPQ
jgi:hypothetical protein